MAELRIETYLGSSFTPYNTCNFVPINGTITTVILADIAI